MTFVSYADKITVVMSSSPIPSHPSTEIVDRVLASTQFHLPGVKTMLLCDGLRVPEHESRRSGYQGYKAAMRTRPLVEMIEYENSVQQAFMIREALRHVTTPLVLQQEHDYALTSDLIDWEGIIHLLETGQANVVRFHNLEHIHPQHEHLMLDGVFEGADGYHGGSQVRPIPIVDGVPILRTLQFWFCPFLTTAKWFREQMDDPRKFSADTYCEIEPALYTWVNSAPWSEYRVMVYAPSEPSMRRSQHLGGRGHDKDDPKREMKW
jgi:hypothetical protein